MHLKITWLNCFWLLIPFLVWNIVFYNSLAHPAFWHDLDPAHWISILENILRAGIFGIPLFLPLRWKTGENRIGIALYLAGALIYFASWLPLILAPYSAWSSSLVGFTSTAWTTLIWLAGISLIGESKLYLFLSVIFTAVHTLHWALVLQAFSQ